MGELGMISKSANILAEHRLAIPARAEAGTEDLRWRHFSSPALSVGEGARRADEGCSAQQSGMEALTLASLGPSPGPDQVRGHPLPTRRCVGEELTAANMPKGLVRLSCRPAFALIAPKCVHGGETWAWERRTMHPCACPVADRISGPDPGLFFTMSISGRHGTFNAVD
jgi:hypothetical protein